MRIFVGLGVYGFNLLAFTKFVAKSSLKLDGKRIVSGVLI